jgi:5-formyltetrahydrofolate cyclo-ligase
VARPPATGPSVPERKAALRGSALAARRGMSRDERREASEAIVARLLDLPEVRARTHPAGSALPASGATGSAGTAGPAGAAIALYAALPEEVDLATAVGPLRSRGWRTLFPRVRGEELDLVAASDLRTLTLGYRGINEPSGVRIDPEVVRVAVVPGVAFDPHGGRLGHGGGHYDRLLPRLPADALRIGVAFACQLVPAVPREGHDAAVDLVLTERATHRSHA